MSVYNPDKWLIVKINSENPHYRVFATWGGGYLNGDSWKLNSGITKVTENQDYYFFEGSSGSTYVCRKGMYGSTGYGWAVINNMRDQSAEEQNITIDILPEETNVMELAYE
jgi:hypothetical protein